MRRKTWLKVAMTFLMSAKRHHRFGMMPDTVLVKSAGAKAPLVQVGVVVGAVVLDLIPVGSVLVLNRYRPHRLVKAIGVVVKIHLSFTFPVHKIGGGVSGKSFLRTTTGTVHVVSALGVQHIRIAKLHGQGVGIGSFLFSG